MLDKNTESVLFTIVNKCNGNYKILDSQDFEITDNLDRHINILCERGYILLQYSVNGEYLLLPTLKGQEYFSDKKQTLTQKAVLCKQVKKSAFWGAFCGTLIIQAMSVILYFLAIKV